MKLFKVYGLAPVYTEVRAHSRAAAITRARDIKTVWAPKLERPIYLVDAYTEKDVAMAAKKTKKKVAKKRTAKGKTTKKVTRKKKAAAA